MFDAFQAIFRENITGQTSNYGLSIKNNELLTIFLLMSNNEENSEHLKKVLTLIFKFFHSDWSEEVQFLASSCIYSFISSDQCREVILNDENLLRILKSPLHENSKRIEYLRRNILSELQIEYKERKDEREDDITEKYSMTSPIFFSFHKVDEKIAFKITKLYEKKTEENNFLFSTFESNS